MDDDWDLHAVVRGCTAAVTNTTTVSNTTATTTNNPFPSFPSSSFHDDQNSFDFPNLIDDRNFSDPYQGLHEIYQELCGDDPPHTTAAAAADISATSIMSIPAAQVFQPHQEIVPPFQMNMQNIQENIQFNNRLGSNSQNFPAATIPQPIRPRRRKNQQTKMVRQMTQEELSADSWAWRKYGQKPIKGSPYPRNYYRCSTSKGCAARKQVERSPNDPGIFVVSYTGEHTHPRPTHRSSLAGSTRSKFVATKNINNTNAFLSQKGSTSSSSRATGSSFFPTTPSMEGEAAAQNNDVEMAEEDDGAGDEDDENMITIPNDLMNDDDDIFKGFQDSDDHSSGGGGDLFSSGLLSPPWSPTGSAGNAATFSGGGSG